MRTLAKQEEEAFPLAENIVRESFYKDDCLHGAHSVEDAVQLQDQLQNLLAKGGFNLRKWSSNSNEFLQAISTSSVLENQQELQPYIKLTIMEQQPSDIC